MAQLFRFKQFSIEQEGAAHPVGTDAVVLGVLAQVERARHILDIGTGTGVIALIAAQRAQNARVVGIDLDKETAARAASNFARSPFADRLQAWCADIRQISEQELGQFDIILCNPPFFKTAPHAMGGSRRIARVADTLTLGQLAEGAVRLLCEGGTLWAIIPKTSENQLVFAAWEQGLSLLSRTYIHTRADKEAKRVVLALKKSTSPYRGERRGPLHLILTDTAGNRTAEWAALTAEFYI